MSCHDEPVHTMTNPKENTTMTTTTCTTCSVTTLGTPCFACGTIAPLSFGERRALRSIAASPPDLPARIHAGATKPPKSEQRALVNYAAATQLVERGLVERIDESPVDVFVVLTETGVAAHAELQS